LIRPDSTLSIAEPAAYGLLLPSEGGVIHSEDIGLNLHVRAQTLSRRREQGPKRTRRPKLAQTHSLHRRNLIMMHGKMNCAPSNGQPPPYLPHYIGYKLYA
jgi:hypothetical protein